MSERTNEIGVRLALGARSGQIVRLVVGGGLALAAVGTVAGAAGALALGGTLTRLLFGVSAFDVRIYLGLAAAGPHANTVEAGFSRPDRYQRGTAPPTERV